MEKLVKKEIREFNERSASLKFGWLYVPKNFSRIGKLHKSYRPSGTGYFEGLEQISFEPWMVEIECLPEVREQLPNNSRFVFNKLFLGSENIF